MSWPTEEQIARKAEVERQVRSIVDPILDKFRAELGLPAPEGGEYDSLVDHHPGHRVPVEQQRVETKNEAKSPSDCAPSSGSDSLELSPDTLSERTRQRNSRLSTDLDTEGEGRESLPTHTVERIKSLRFYNLGFSDHLAGFAYCTVCGIFGSPMSAGTPCPDEPCPGTRQKAIDDPKETL